MSETVFCPFPSVITQRNCQPFKPFVVATDNVLVFAPLWPEFVHSEEEFFRDCHWYFSVALPVASTDNATFVPAFTLAAVGCFVIFGTRDTVTKSE